MMKILAVIPARGGSKGVPGKNIKLLGRKPLLQYSFDAAMGSAYINRVILSSEDPRIIACAQSMGMDVPFVRPEHLSSDATPTIDVLRHAVSVLESKGEFYDAVCLLQPTSPFRTTQEIDDALKRFYCSGADSLISVLAVPFQYNPHWCFEEDSNGTLKIATGERDIIPRRQELPASYHRDGSIYVTKRDVLMEQSSLYGASIAYCLSNQARYVNIDTIDDWRRAEELLTQLNQNE